MKGRGRLLISEYGHGKIMSVMEEIRWREARVVMAKRGLSRLYPVYIPMKRCGAK